MEVRRNEKYCTPCKNEKKEPRQKPCFTCGTTIEVCTNRKYCVDCSKDVRVENQRRWREQNPERANAHYAKYRAENPEKRIESQAKWRASNIEEVRRKGREYKADNKERIKEHEKQYEIDHPGRMGTIRKKYREKHKVRIKKYLRRWGVSSKGKLIKSYHSATRRAKERECFHDFTPEEWMKKKLRTKGHCPHCKKKVGINKLTLDHTPPISKAPKGFVYTIKHMTPLCGSCNSVKHNS